MSLIKGFDYTTIKSYSDVCDYLGLPYDDNVSNIDKIEFIIRVINNGWKPDFKDINQKKWYAFFTINDDGVSKFWGVDYDLNFFRFLPFTQYIETEEKAEYFGKTFSDLYNIA